MNDNEWDALLEEVDIVLDSMEAKKLDTAPIIDLVEESTKMRMLLSVQLPKPGTTPIAFEWTTPTFGKE
jgi:hypothetical protein